MHPNPLWFRTVEEVSLNCFLDVSAQFFPRVALSEYALSQAFRRITTFRFFGDFENKLADSRTNHRFARSVKPSMRQISWQSLGSFVSYIHSYRCDFSPAAACLLNS